LIPHFSNLLEKGHSNIVVNLTIACKGYPVTQEILEAIAKLYLPEFPKREKDLASIMLEDKTGLGAILCGALFRIPYEKIRPVVDGFLDLPSEVLLEYAHSKERSSALQSLVAGGHLPLAPSKRLRDKFSGHFAEMACDKYATFFVEDIFINSTMEIKKSIVEELLPAKQQLLQHGCGKIILMKCEVNRYQANKGDWAFKFQEQEGKKTNFVQLLEKLELIPKQKKSLEKERRKLKYSKEGREGLKQEKAKKLEWIAQKKKSGRWVQKEETPKKKKKKAKGKSKHNKNHSIGRKN